ncbi:MAG: CinA family protein [Candidatus Methanoplasma sp.]|jgi:nicotinamide-nucleotide amidase|nr:CinA family protein [Candidatus Methanoplasma sp.]
MSERIVSAEDISSLFAKRNYSLSVAESCTGGLIGATITSVPGSSKFFLGSTVVYSNAAKENILGVRHGTLEKYGAVSKETAKEMAECAFRIFDSDIAVSVTGIAGPGGGTVNKPVGLVFIGITDRKHTETKEFTFTGNRDSVRKSAVDAALGYLIEFIEGKQ